MRVNLRYRPTPDNAPLLAGEAVLAVRQISGVTLDYSIASLYQLDRIIDDMRAHGCEVADVSETLFGFGCYVGEVFVRQAGGEWWAAADTSLRDAGVPLVVQLGDGHFCNPIGKVFDRLQHHDDDGLIHFFQTLCEPL